MAMYQLLINWLKVRVLPGPPSFYQPLEALAGFSKKLALHFSVLTHWRFLSSFLNSVMWC